MADEVAKFRLGFVRDPLPGHGKYAGMLAIPYMRWSPGIGWSVVSIRFRCVVSDCNHYGHGKYNTVAGDTPRLYNAIALLTNDDVIGISEGEIDAITATVSGLPTVGVAGVHCWKPHFVEPFLGYERVFIFGDADDAGQQFAETLKTELPNGRIITLPDGEDINSTVLAHGKGALLERLKH